MEDLDNQGFMRKNIIWFVVLAALIIFGFLLFKGWDDVVNDEIDGMVTVTGNFSCLPLRLGVEPADPEEMCVLGVRGRDGLFYALDVSRIQDANTDLKAEDTIAVTGTIKPQTEPSLPQWADYDITGVIMVNTLLRTR